VSEIKAQKRTVTALVFAAALFGAVVAMTGFGIGAAQAQPNPCDIRNFQTPDGGTDTTGYLACVQGISVTAPDGGTGGGGTLPVTGSDLGKWVAIAVALMALGGAAVYGSTRARRPAVVKTD
jgi:hypothetical protein